MLQHFRDELVLPHLVRLRLFDPLAARPSSREFARKAYDA